MTSVTDICNRALQGIGTRTDVTDAELANNSTNEAKQFNLAYTNNRDDLLRMAPWNCALKTANLTYITSVPGTPENTSAATTLWTPGQPAPPWTYEYQYPQDCLRACLIIPANQTGFSGGVPITPAVTGGAAAFWRGPPVKFKVAIDQFYPVTSATVANGGTGHAVGDIITLPIGPITSPPIGAPVQLQVTSAPGGVIATVAVVNVVDGSSVPLGGSYFAVQANPVAQASTTGVGINATFNLTQGPQDDQRVILTNQEFATLAYCRQVTNPNVWDSLFQSALINLCAADLGIALRGWSNEQANARIKLVNESIELARAIDGDEGLTVNDVTPDWLRIRGVTYSEGYSGPYQFDWGPMWPVFS